MMRVYDPARDTAQVHGNPGRRHHSWDHHRGPATFREYQVFPTEENMTSEAKLAVSAVDGHGLDLFPHFSEA